MRQEAIAQYQKMLKLGQKQVRERTQQGAYPYLPCLDWMLQDRLVSGRVELGLLSIPMERIAGTKFAGRQNSFSADFAPLLPLGTEFADKWTRLCDAHLGDTGITDPIRCYEYLGKFYVQEGHKRVSVLRSFDAPTVSAYVTRVIPAWSEEPEIQAYYEFLKYYALTGTYLFSFSRQESYAKMQAALGFAPEHVWTEEERRSFSAAYARFENVLEKTAGDRSSLTTADAMLEWLQVYPYTQLTELGPQELEHSIQQLWPDLEVLDKGANIQVNDVPQEKESKSLLERVLDAVLLPNKLTVAFIYEGSPENSPWNAAHDRGRAQLEERYEGTVTVRTYVVGDYSDREAAMTQAVTDGADVIFATTVSLIRACRKIAAAHPQVRVLNCAVAMPYAGVRTYYSRIYESKFIAGAIAGAMAEDGRIGYVAHSPVLGVPADVNAFALGARLVNPRVRITLRWSCCEAAPEQRLLEQGIRLISGRELPLHGDEDPFCGLVLCAADGEPRRLAIPYRDWGPLYIRLIGSILHGGWDALSAKGDRAVNYWWGIGSGAADVWLSDTLPDGVRDLAELLHRGIADGTLAPFYRKIVSQDGLLRNNGAQWFSPEEILHMDWLCSFVDGAIPTFEELLPVAQPLVRLQGIYRDQIPPEQETTV